MANPLAHMRFGFLNRSTPTLDFYFLAAMHDFVRGGIPLPKHDARRFIRRIGPNCFFGNGRAIIVRYATLKELEKIAKLKPLHCIYVVDDDFTVASEDDTLPAEYRKKLLKFFEEIHPRIVEICDWVAAPNKIILNRYSGKNCKELYPSYVNKPADMHHFEHHYNVNENNNISINIVYSGTRSHLVDLELIAPMLAAFCRRHPEVTLTTFLGKYAPSSLHAPNIRHLKPLSWRVYKRMQRRARYHVALAPMRDTPFNRARSLARVLDHAAFGAASLYPALPIFGQHVTHGENGLLLPAIAEAWEEALEQMIENRAWAYNLAAGNIALARNIGNPQHQRNWWLYWFGVTEGDVNGGPC